MPDTDAPLIGITANVRIEGPHTIYSVRREYASFVTEAGGVPVILPHEPGRAIQALDRVDGVLITGGDDIDMRVFGIDLHPRAVVMPRLRQDGEFALLEALDQRPEMPVLGVCLGMQLMGVHAGCRLIQHLHDEHPDGADGAEAHVGDRPHAIACDLGCGSVASSHHQALAEAGPFEVLTRSADGVIEAIRDPRRPFYVGVQWHPERTKDPALGLGIIRRLVEAARRRTATLVSTKESS